MTKDEAVAFAALKLALEALTYIHAETSTEEDVLINEAITAIKEALTPTSTQCEKQPAQKPVAWLVEFESGEQELHFETQSVGESCVPLYVQRPWVGLTDEERNYCVETPFVSQQWANIEAKLKELNI